MAEKHKIYAQSGLNRIVHAMIAPVFLYWAAGRRHYRYNPTVGSCCPWYQLFAVVSIPTVVASGSLLYHGGDSAATVTTTVSYDGNQRLKEEGEDGTEMYGGVAGATGLALNSSSQDLAAFQALQTGFRLYVRRGQDLLSTELESVYDPQHVTAASHCSKQHDLMWAIPRKQLSNTLMQCAAMCTYY